VSGTAWSKFFWSDWQNDPALRLCSLSAQGLWMRMLCVAAEADPIGYVTVNGRALGVTDIARLAGVTETECESLLSELDRNGVFSRDNKQRIYSRRLVRDAKRAALARKNGKNGGNPRLCPNTENPRPDNPPLKGEVKPHKPLANSQVTNLSAAVPIAEGATAASSKPEEGPATAPAVAVGRRAAIILGVENDPNWLGTYQVCSGWLAEGFDVEADIIPTISAVWERMRAAGKPAPGTLKYFTKAIRQTHAERTGGQRVTVHALQSEFFVIKKGTAPWRAWLQYKKAAGEKTTFMEQQDQWTVPHEWPPRQSSAA
jgi:hypothetical protein